MFVSTFQCIIHNILKRAKYVGKLIIKAAWRTCRFNSCVGSVYRNNPVPSAVERDINQMVVELLMDRTFKNLHNNW